MLHRVFYSLIVAAFCCGLVLQPALSAADDSDTVVTLLFTNDIESACEPVPAFWLEDMDTSAEFVREYAPLGDLTIEYFRKYNNIPMPQRGRQVGVANR